MSLFKHKNDLQGYKAKSPLQREMFSLTENTFKELQQTTLLDYNTLLLDLVKSMEYAKKGASPG